MFCRLETVDFVIYQESKGRKNKTNYYTYENTFTKHSRFSAVQRSRVRVMATEVMAHVFFFCYSPVNNALSPSRADARKTVQFRKSHMIRQ